MGLGDLAAVHRGAQASCAWAELWSPPSVCWTNLSPRGEIKSSSWWLARQLHRVNSVDADCKAEICLMCSLHAVWYGNCFQDLSPAHLSQLPLSWGLFSKKLDHENKCKWLLHLRSKLIDTYFSTQLRVNILCIMFLWKVHLEPVVSFHYNLTSTSDPMTTQWISN